MESKENFEDLAFRKSLLPVSLYLGLSVLLFFAIDWASEGANHIFGDNNVKLVQILKLGFIGLLTTFLIFYLVYKYKFVEVNASRNMNAVFTSSPYPVLIVKLKNHSISSCSQAMMRLLGYTANEIKSLTLKDILSEGDFKRILEEHANLKYINRDYAGLHFLDKGRQVLSLSVNVMRYELLDHDYLLVRCSTEKVVGKPVFEESDSPSPGPVKKSFQF